MSAPDPDTPPSQPPTGTGFDARAALTWGMVLGIAASALVWLFTQSEWQWTWSYWGEQQIGPDGETATGFNRSEIFRNLGLAALALVGLGLATWRSWTAHNQANIANRQAEIANKQAETASRQADLSERGHIIDRVNKGVEWLESDKTSVTIAGIYTLRETAIADPETWYIIVQDLLCDFVRERSNERKPLEERKKAPLELSLYPPFPSDLQTALKTISDLRETVETAKKLEDDADWRPRLRSAKLVAANLSGLHLMRADLAWADLTGAKLVKTLLTEADLTSADLTMADMFDPELTTASLDSANVSRAKLTISNYTKEFCETMWAYDDWLPHDTYKHFTGKIALRHRGEAWREFLERIITEHPDLGWTWFSLRYDPDSEYQASFKD